MLAAITPFDLITNQVFQAIVTISSFIIGIAGVLVGVWLYKKGKPLKLIVYEITSDTPAVSIKREVEKGKIKIEYQDSTGHLEEISDATLLTLKVWNAGTTDIRIWNSSDTDIENREVPIELEFDKRKVVNLTQVKTVPLEDVILQKDLDTYLNNPAIAPDRLGLPPCLLKKSQSIELAVLLKGEGKKIKIGGKLFNGQIRNFREIAQERSKIENRLYFVAIAAVFLVIAGYILISRFIFPSPAHNQPTGFPFLIYYLLATTTCTFLFLWWVAHRLTRPYVCSCGYRTRFSGRFKRHVLLAH